MSLLLDALKRAEQEKLARQPGTPPQGGRAGAVSAVAANANLELQPIGGTPAAPSSAAPSPRQDPAAAHAAQNVFLAKAAENDAEKSRAGLWLLVGAIAFVAIAAASYVWYTVKSLTPAQAGVPRPRAAPTPPPASSAPLPPTAAMGSIVPAPGTVAPQAEPPPGATTAAPVPTASLTSYASVSPITTAAAPPPLPAETPAERIARSAVAPARPPLQLERSAPTGRRVPAEVAQGYEALRRGEPAAARRAYDSAIASDPTSIDAHLGLATLAARENNRVAAADHYRRVLDLDPRNATAIAGLAALADFSRPEALETQLRADLDRTPDSAALQFTLGNLYASHGRWSEAQAAYYEAHRLDPASPEIAFNLAVSLDRMGQSQLAANFYRRALEGARGRAAAFDPAAVERRLAEIR